MTDQNSARTVLSDAFGRVNDLVTAQTEGLTEEASTYRPGGTGNSIGWLLWHLSRVQDDHIAGAAGMGQVWPIWRERFGLPFDDGATGYGQSSADVDAVRVSAKLLAGYHADVHLQTMSYLDSINPAELERVVDDSWDPPVTASARLVSVVSDCLQHLGQAAYVRGLASSSSTDSDQPV